MATPKLAQHCNKCGCWLRVQTALGRDVPWVKAWGLVREKLWGGRRRSWHLHRPYEL